MRKFLSRYPDRSAGFGLLLLRLAGAVIMASVYCMMPGWLAVSVASALLLGFRTGAAASVLAIVAVAQARGLYSDVEHIALAAAVALLGPGAYSIDAIVFGRRVMRIGLRSPDKGEPG